MTDEVPAGTAADVLTWVGDDPARAELALDAEYDGANRSTLIAKLETIAAKEAPVSDEPATEVEEVPAPEQPVEVELDAADSGVIISSVAVRDADVEVPDDADLTPEELTEGETAPIGAEPVEYMQAASGTNGLVVSFNGTSYSMNADQAAQLKGQVDRAIVGLSL